MIGKSDARHRAQKSTQASVQAGFTYLWLLLTVAMGSAGAVIAGEVWSTHVLRSKEQEQVFRLAQFALALNSYASATPVGKPCLPMTLEELLEDKRSAKTNRHLRRLYTDPFSGGVDWVIERGVGGVITQVRSARRLTLLEGPAAEGSPAARGFGGLAAPSATATASDKCPRAVVPQAGK